MFATGVVLLIFGIVVGLFGWVLNTETPIQQPLPVVGAGMFLLGLIIMAAS
jgi:hypothetical protein